MVLPQLDPIMSPLPHALLVSRSSGAGKGVSLIPWETSGKIAPVVGIILPFHGDFLTRVELRRSPYGQHERGVQHRSLQARAFNRHKATCIVIVGHRR